MMMEIEEGYHEKANRLHTICDAALARLMESQGHIDCIHNPRQFTKYQDMLMTAVVEFCWPNRFDIKFAAAEITESICILEDLVPPLKSGSSLYNLELHQRTALE